MPAECNSESLPTPAAASSTTSAVRCPLSAVRRPLSAVRCPLSAGRCPPTSKQQAQAARVARLADAPAEFASLSPLQGGYVALHILSAAAGTVRAPGKCQKPPDAPTLSLTRRPRAPTG
ncbi:unnamed protein product [Cercospora beticola]|nr:unnamed protein product [Cercospora beticola]